MSARALLAVGAAFAVTLFSPALAWSQAAPTAAPASPAGAAESTAADQTYVLGLADVISVSVLGRKDFTSVEGRISEDGTIQLPYLGSVPAAGRTTATFTDQVAQALERGGFFVKPVVKVDIKSFASRYVTVLGEVGKPGLVPIDRPYRISEVLARVGGLKDSGSDYVVVRKPDGSSKKLWVKEVASGDLAADPYVAPGDRIYAPVADLFYISGAVTKPGEYKLTQDMTVRLAIARAGGVNALGSDKKVKLTRKGAKIVAKLDMPLQPGDVIVIGERLF